MKCIYFSWRYLSWHHVFPRLCKEIRRPFLSPQGLVAWQKKQTIVATFEGQFLARLRQLRPLRTITSACLPQPAS